MTKQATWITLGLVAFMCLMMYVLSPIIGPFFYGAVVAYLLNPFVNYLIRFKLSRTTATILTFFLLVTFVLLMLILLVPLLQNQIVILLNKIPQILEWVQNEAIPKIQYWFNLPIDWNLNDLKNTVTNNWQQVGKVASSVGVTVAMSGIVVVKEFIKIVIFFVVTFYLLRDWKQVLHELKTYLPRRMQPAITEFIEEANQILSGFFRGQVLVMLSLAVLYTIGLWIIGLDLALLIGIIIGIFSIIPYLGTIIGVVLALGAAWLQFHAWGPFLYVGILFIVGHILEGMVLTPILVGDRIGLHPVVVIFAVLAGGQLNGIIGALFALPVAAVLVVLLRNVRHRYIQHA